MPSYSVFGNPLTSPIPAHFLAKHDSLSKEELIQKLWEAEQENYELMDAINMEVKNTVKHMIEEPSYFHVLKSFFDHLKPKIDEPSDSNNNPSSTAQKIPTSEIDPLLEDRAVLIARKAISEESEKPLKERSIILNNILAPMTDKELFQFLKPIKDGAEISGKVEIIRFSNKTTVCLRFPSRDHVQKFVRTLTNLRKTNPKIYGCVKMRKDLTKSELAIHRKLWAIAIFRNNQLNSFVWSVRNLKLVKLVKPKPWKNSTPENSDQDSDDDYPEGDKCSIT